jgi:lipopolysaccharide/colanic/teichoic acid biosynthesis glycosyltransferase
VTSSFAIEPAPAEGLYLRFGKRAFDLLVSGTLLAFLLPLFVIVAIAVRCDSSGAAIYRCRRLGHRGVPFSFWKFRSMVDDADLDKCNLLHMNEVDGPVFKVADDPRMTRVGRFLRRSSLDELPQLIHVFRGQMTLVGPRPPEPDEVTQYEPWQLRRLSVRPGLTCLWQISGRSLIGFDEWMRLDLEYVDNRSFKLDLLILLRTLPAVISGRGAF